MLEEFDTETLEVIGTGISFPPRTNLQGTLQLSFSTPNLEQSILIILRTSPGERVYRPDFGCRLGELVFEPLNTQTLLRIRNCVQEALDMWEPRIEVLNIRTEPDPTVGVGKVDIEILYQPKATHTIRSLVFPFYLLSAET
jgi:uncharacterized protein